MCCYDFPITMRSELLLFQGITDTQLHFVMFPAVHSVSLCGSNANSCPESRAVNHHHMLASPPQPNAWFLPSGQHSGILGSTHTLGLLLLTRALIMLVFPTAFQGKTMSCASFLAAVLL